MTETQGNSRTLALVPARGGSKGLPRKNLLPLVGKPLIAWTIEQGLASTLVDSVVVTTDDEEIASVSRQYGAEIPFMRPAEFATDLASSIDVVLHAIRELGAMNREFDFVILLEPTSPLRHVTDIDACIEALLAHRDAEAVVTVSPLESQHPVFSTVIDADGFIRRPTGGSDFEHFRRQDLTPAYFFEGTCYASRVDAIIQRRTFYHEKTLAHVVPRWRSLEVDDKYDLVCAEALMNYVLKGGAQ